MINKLLIIIFNKYVFLIANIRAVYWHMFVKKLGKEVYFFHGVRLLSPKGISIGHHIRINHHTDLGGHGNLTIGNYVQIGPYCQILTANHGFMDRDRLIWDQAIVKKSIYIGDDVWIGSHVIILPGVKVNNGAVIGSHAVVTKDVPGYAVAVGNPARVIKYRK
jgi:maltose O-acetyltransferase